MSTVAVMPTTGTVAGPSFWDRITTRLQTWGGKIKSGLKRVWNWTKGKLKWLWTNKATQFVVTKAKAGFSLAWPYIKWVGVPLLAVTLAPKTITVMLGASLLLTAALTLSVVRIGRELKRLDPERWESIMDQVSGVSINDEVTVEETVDSRYTHLDTLNVKARDEGDWGLFSETTARLFLIEARRGNIQGLKPTAAVNLIHQACRRDAEAKYPNAAWEWNRMYQATRSEDKRLKDLAALKKTEAEKVPATV